MAELIKVKIDRLIYGGQAMAALADGRKAMMWNALPGEEVLISIQKQKKDYVMARVEQIIISSNERRPAADEAFLSTSPWQIMTIAAENRYKQLILKDLFQRAGRGYGLAKFISLAPYDHYRNKLEYAFWADEQGLSLAVYQRGSHKKIPVRGHSLANPVIDSAAQQLLQILNDQQVRASQLKSLTLRCSQSGEVVAALFVKDKNFKVLKAFKTAVKGVEVIFSDPRSPASVVSQKLYNIGDTALTDDINGQKFAYGVRSFFQVHLPVYEAAIKAINNHLTAYDFHPLMDSYSGVGSIGLSVGADILVENDLNNKTWLTANNHGRAEIIFSDSAAALAATPKLGSLILDPPRSGLTPKIIDQILTAQPKSLTYLSCNPSTQARDIAQLQPTYEVKLFQGYNFFPRTPHIESLIIMLKK